MQVTPYKGQHRTEYHVEQFYNPEPQAKKEQRREEIALGIFEKRHIKTLNRE